MALHSKNRHYNFKDIQRRHFSATAAKFFQRESAEDVIKEVLDDLERAIAAVTARLPARYPERVATSVFAGLRRTPKLLANAAA
jgi:serine/threonine-protein kinase HipA